MTILMEGVMDRCPTGVKGFDKICHGGFVRNSDNLIVGGPGSGKSTFLLQFLWNGATMYNENGLYISFEPDIVDTINDAMAFGWDFTKISGEGRIKFMRFSPQTSIDDLKSEIVKIVSRFNIRRVCFDPISVLALNMKDPGKMREKIFEISSLMKRFKVTTVFADESMEGEGIERIAQGEWTKTDILRFLSDSVTLFYESGITGVGDRAVKILKMRRTAHLREAVGMQIEENGIQVFHEGPEMEEVEVEEPHTLAPEKLLEPIDHEIKPEIKPAALKLPKKNSPIPEVPEQIVPEHKTIEQIQHSIPPEDPATKQEVYETPVQNQTFNEPKMNQTIVSSEPILKKESPDLLRPSSGPTPNQYPPIEQNTEMKMSAEVPTEIAKKAQEGLNKIRETPESTKEPKDDELWH